MHLLVSKQNIGELAADTIKSRVAAFAPCAGKPFVLGLPTGETVLDMYARLRQLYSQHLLDFQHVTVFHMDEYIGLSAQDPHSYGFYLKQQLFDFVNLTPSHIHLLNGNAADLTAECQAYENLIKQVGAIHLFIGGVGCNGHIAFNEPGSAFTSRTRPVPLAEGTRQANSRFFQKDLSQVPSQALTVGIGTLLEAKELLFLATGPQKAPAVAKALGEEISPQVPLSALRLHPRATLLADEEACSLLPTPLQYQLRQAQLDDPHATQWKLEI